MTDQLPLDLVNVRAANDAAIPPAAVAPVVAANDAAAPADPRALAEARRDDGMRRAVDHADAVSPGWGAVAFLLVAAWCVRHRGEHFLAERVREDLEPHLPMPPDRRAWGSVFVRAVREHLIVRVGFGPANSSNRGPKSIWRAT
jgi:hypothetical protein